MNAGASVPQAVPCNGHGQVARAGRSRLLFSFWKTHRSFWFRTGAFQFTVPSPQEKKCTSGSHRPCAADRCGAYCVTALRCRLSPPLWGEENRHFGSLRPASLRRHMRSAAPFSPQFCTCAPTAGRRCPLGSVLADEQPHRSRSAAVSRSERSAQATRPPLAALAIDLIASSISRPSTSKLSMMDIVDREADAERPRGG